MLTFGTRLPASPARAAFAAVVAGAAFASVLAWQVQATSSGLHVQGAWAAVAILALLAAALAWRSTGETTGRDGDLVPAHALGELVLWHAMSGDVLRASDAASAVVGASARSLLGGGFLSRVHVSDRPAYLKSLSDAANGAAPVLSAFRLHRSDGEGDSAGSKRAEVIWAEMRCQKLPAAPQDGADATVLAVVRDVTAIRDQTAEIDAARQDAERANEMKGRFLANVTHELRTPLNAIIGFSELLSADHPYLITDERRKEYAEIIKTSGHHLLEIVNTLLDMSKIESGNFTYEPETFSIRDLATSACDLMQLKADQAGIEIRRDFDGIVPEIVADRRACRQILINLLSNAVKFTPSGGRVSLTLRQHPAEALTVAVADTGVGIPAADLPRLGDPFFQSGDVHRRHHEGTGLGLSVVRGLVGLHGGHMSIESGTGAGTTVTVVLPLRSEPGAAQIRPVPVQTRPRAPGRPPERMSA